MSVMDRFDPGRQPAGRLPAPGRLGYVQAFLNSFWDLDNDGIDRWETTDGLAAWLGERGFDSAVGEAERRRTVALRDGLRAALRGDGWGGVQEDAALRVRHDGGGGTRAGGVDRARSAARRHVGPDEGLPGPALRLGVP
jgi:hypothetical protein